MMKDAWYYCAATAILGYTVAVVAVSVLVRCYKQNLRLMDLLMSAFLPDSEEELDYEKTQAHYLYGQKKQGGTTSEG